MSYSKDRRFLCFSLLSKVPPKVLARYLGAGHGAQGTGQSYPPACWGLIRTVRQREF